MSYEGIVQELCSQGHLRTLDCYDSSHPYCEECGSEIVWSHSVDQTNGDQGVAYAEDFLVPREDGLWALPEINISATLSRYWEKGYFVGMTDLAYQAYLATKDSDLYLQLCGIIAKYKELTDEFNTQSE